MIKVEKKNKIDEYVYDISLDGTVVNALGMNIVSNTDGFNFQMPREEDFRYTDEHPYISNGGGRNSINGKAYTGVDADVAEFEDLYMHSPFNGGINKNGLGIDEFCDATINFARKNYADLMPDGKKKLVGNTIKSKKMPIYIEKFLDKAIDLLLHGKGKEFLEYYYDYVKKIYDLQIPLKDIATVGKIKISIDSYKKNCMELTAGGTKKARQAWYELAIKDNLNVNMGDTIYYINTGNKKSTSDVQRVTKLYLINEKGEKQYNVIENGEIKTDRKGNPVTLTKEIDKLYSKFKKENKENTSILQQYKNSYEFAKSLYPKIQEEDEVVFNCVRLSNEVVEDEDEHFCDDNLEYNYEKYIDMFNKRIKPLLVCFDKSIRTVINDKGKEVDNILINNPKDRKTFTEEESKLVSGQPYNVTDQDTYEQLMTMEDKEIKFWISINKIPPYAKECGIDWEKTKSDYELRMKELERVEIKNEFEIWETVISEFKQSDVTALIEEYILPNKLDNIASFNLETGEFYSKKFPNIKFGNIHDLIDKDFSIDCTEENE